ncbi:hypothetical protein QJS10_CPB12g00741 [Acorus calamus]|uniref:CCHC-type domain-containing protein n=1 Tax=Acorus calamus TaxID=4465 RepID=A0AAV9DLH2_ACOCL|nr:hypothetical protein QJS10_CPB12g00741 [Acorus calamus]
MSGGEKVSSGEGNGGEPGVRGKGKEAEWVVVTRKRRSTPGRGWEGESSSKLSRCFRCLGWGHKAMDCREPPKCWRCGRWGHRSFRCWDSMQRNRTVARPHIERGGGVYGNSGGPSAEVRKPEVRSEEHFIPWSPALADREERFSRSVLMEWKGTQGADWGEIERAILGRWTDIPPFQMWTMGNYRAIIRLPSISVKGLFLCEKEMRLQLGSVRFFDCDHSVGAKSKNNCKVVVTMKGLPLLWRSVEVIRVIVRNWGHLLGVSEVEEVGEEFPVLQVTIWSNLKAEIPSSVCVSLDGWRVPILLEVEGIRGGQRSYAEVAGSTTGGGVHPMELDRPGSNSMVKRSSQAVPIRMGGGLEGTGGRQEGRETQGEVRLSQAEKGSVGGGDQGKGCLEQVKVAEGSFHRKGNWESDTGGVKVVNIPFSEKACAPPGELSIGVRAGPPRKVDATLHPWLEAPAIPQGTSRAFAEGPRASLKGITILRRLEVVGHVANSVPLIPDLGISKSPKSIGGVGSGLDPAQYEMRGAYKNAGGQSSLGSPSKGRPTLSGLSDRGSEPDHISGGS